MLHAIATRQMVRNDFSFGIKYVLKRPHIRWPSPIIVKIRFFTLRYAKKCDYLAQPRCKHCTHTLVIKQLHTLWWSTNRLYRARIKISSSAIPWHSQKISSFIIVKKSSRLNNFTNGQWSLYIVISVAAHTCYLREIITDS